MMLIIHVFSNVHKGTISPQIINVDYVIKLYLIVQYARLVQYAMNAKIINTWIL